MSPERVVLCGGAPTRGLGRAAKPLRLDIYGRDPVIHFKLEEVRRALWKDIPNTLRDLLDLAVYVYATDQAFVRAKGGRVDGDEIGAGWRRNFRFRIPVREPDLWRSDSVRDELVSTLSFLSEDEYTFEFTKLTNDRSLDGFIDYDATPYDGEVEEVVMFGVLGAGRGADDPESAYEVELFTDQRIAGPPRTMLTAYLGLVERVEKMGEAEFFAEYGELARVLPHLGLPARAAATRVFELYRKHAGTDLQDAASHRPAEERACYPDSRATGPLGRRRIPQTRCRRREERGGERSRYP